MMDAEAEQEREELEEGDMVMDVDDANRRRR